MITSLEEKRAGLYTSCAFVRLSCVRCILSFFLPLGVRRGLAAAFDCGDPWAFILAF